MDDAIGVAGRVEYPQNFVVFWAEECKRCDQRAGAHPTDNLEYRALYLAVFPANVYMLTDNVSLDPKKPIPRWALWLRLPFQLVFIAWAYWFT